MSRIWDRGRGRASPGRGIVGAKVLRLAYAMCVCGRDGVWVRSSGGSVGVRAGKVGSVFSEETLDARLRNLCQVEFSATHTEWTLSVSREQFAGDQQPSSCSILVKFPISRLSTH